MMFFGTRVFYMQPVLQAEVAVALLEATSGCLFFGLAPRRLPTIFFFLL